MPGSGGAFSELLKLDVKTLCALYAGGILDNLAHDNFRGIFLVQIGLSGFLRLE